MSTIEEQARLAWRLWGDGYAAYCACASCGIVQQCRGKKRAKMLCLDCFDAQ